MRGQVPQIFFPRTATAWGGIIPLWTITVSSDPYRFCFRFLFHCFFVFLAWRKSYTVGWKRWIVNKSALAATVPPPGESVWPGSSSIRQKGKTNGRTDGRQTDALPSSARRRSCNNTRNLYQKTFMGLNGSRCVGWLHQLIARGGICMEHKSHTTGEDVQARLLRLVLFPGHPILFRALVL